jgi:hypothetical protein
VAKISPRSATNAKSNRGGRRKGSGAPPSTIKGVLATLPERYKAAFLRSAQNAIEVMIKSILRGEKVTHVKTKTPTAVTPVEALERSPNEAYEICSPRSGRGGSRRGSGRKPFTLEGICSRYPQRAQRLRRDVMRLALEEVSRRFGIRTQQLRVKRKLASQRGGKRVPGPGKKLGRSRGTYNPSNVPAYLRTLRTELGIRELSDMRVALPMAELNKLLSTPGLANKSLQRKARGSPDTDARLTVVAGCKLVGINDYKISPHAYPLQNNKAAAWRTTQSFLRRHAAKITERQRQLSKLSETDRLASIEKAQKQLRNNSKTAIATN